MNKPDLLREAKETLYSSSTALYSGNAGGSAAAAGHFSMQHGLQLGSCMLPAGARGAAHLQDESGSLAAFEERAKLMTANPFFVLHKTLLVKDVVTSGGANASFNLSANWNKCDKFTCERCQHKGCSRVVGALPRASCLFPPPSLLPPPYSLMLVGA